MYVRTFLPAVHLIETFVATLINKPALASSETEELRQTFVSIVTKLIKWAA